MAHQAAIARFTDAAALADDAVQTLDGVDTPVVPGSKAAKKPMKVEAQTVGNDTNSTSRNRIEATGDGDGDVGDRAESSFNGAPKSVNIPDTTSNKVDEDLLRTEDEILNGQRKAMLIVQ